MIKITSVHKELASIAAAVLTLCTIATALASEIVTVVQKDRKFQTRSIGIKAGDTVHFTNEDPFIHHLYAQSASFSFSSDEQATGVPLDVVFPVAGTFEVRCQIHPKMVLKVKVK